MASPQKERGYTAIANEIMDVLMRAKIPSEPRRVLDCILRNSYGWNRSAAVLANQEVVEATGLSRSHVSEAISWLKDHRLVIVPSEGNKVVPPEGNKHIVPSKGNKRSPNTLIFNKNYDEWVGLFPQKGTNDCSPRGEQVVPLEGNKHSRKATPVKGSQTPKTSKAIREESENTSYSPPSAASDSEQAASPVEEKPLAKLLGTLPLNDGTDFEIRADLVAELQPLYPAIDVLAELKGMKGWLIGNPKNRKTRKGVMRFITSWLARSQDKAPRIAGSTRPHPNTGAGAPVTYAQKQDQAKRGLAAMVIAHDQETRSQAFADGIGQEGHFMPTPETNGNGLAGYVAGVAGGLRPHEQPALLGSHGQVPQDQPILPEYLGHHPSL